MTTNTMQFYVPQFIDVEDKIFGPLTFKQFVYLVGGGGLSVIIWILLPSFIALMLITPIAALSIALAFYKVNNKPFIHMVEAAIKYVSSARLYIWKKRPKHTDPDNMANSPASQFSPKLSDSKLKDMSWNLDVQNSLYSQVEGGNQNAQKSGIPSKTAGAPEINPTEKSARASETQPPETQKEGLKLEL